MTPIKYSYMWGQAERHEFSKETKCFYITKEGRRLSKGSGYNEYFDTPEECYEDEIKRCRDRIRRHEESISGQYKRLEKIGGQLREFRELVAEESASRQH